MAQKLRLFSSPIALCRFWLFAPYRSLSILVTRVKFIYVRSSLLSPFPRCINMNVNIQYQSIFYFFEKKLKLLIKDLKSNLASSKIGSSAAALALVKTIGSARRTSKEEFLKILNAHTMQELKVNNFFSLKINRSKAFIIYTGTASGYSWSHSNN